MHLFLSLNIYDEKNKNVVILDYRFAGTLIKKVGGLHTTQNEVDKVTTHRLDFSGHSCYFGRHFRTRRLFCLQK